MFGFEDCSIGWRASRRQAMKVRQGSLYALAIGLFFAEACVLAFLACSAFPQYAYAYVDPSVMTYTIQAVAGVAVALSAVAGVFFRRTRKTLFRIFGIDEDTRKEKDPAWRRVDAQGASEYDEQVRAQRASASDEQASGVHGKNLSWFRRFLLALLFSFAFSMTVLIVPPIELVGGNGSSLTLSIGELWWIPVLFGVAVSLAVALLLSLLRGRPFQIALMVCASLAVAAYVQALVLNVNLPIADGEALEWLDHKKDLVISTVAWIAIIAVPLVLSRRNRGRWIYPPVLRFPFCLPANCRKRGRISISTRPVAISRVLSWTI